MCRSHASDEERFRRGGEAARRVFKARVREAAGLMNTPFAAMRGEKRRGSTSRRGR